MNIDDRLVLYLDGIELREPSGKVRPQDTELGVLPEPLRQLWSYLLHIEDAHQAMHAELPFGATAVAHENANDTAEHQRLHAAGDYAKRLFAEQTQALYGDKVSGDDSFQQITVRRGWVLVAARPHPLELLLFHSLLGGVGQTFPRAEPK